MNSQLPPPVPQKSRPVPPVIELPSVSAPPIQKESAGDVASVSRLSSTKAGRSIIGLFLLVIGSLATLAVGIVVAVAISSEAARKDTSEDYYLLCNRLFSDLPVIGAPKEAFSTAEIEIAVSKFKGEVLAVSRRGRQLGTIAQQYVSLVERVEILSANAPKGSKVVFGLAEGLLGLYTGQMDHVGAGGQKALSESENIWNAISEFEQLLHQKQVVSLQLAELASNFSGPTTNNVVLSAHFDESTDGLLLETTRNTLILENLSGLDLHNCVVAVKLSNAKGESFVNMHYLQVWRTGEKRVGTYSSFDFPKTIVPDISQVKVTVRSAECSTEPLLLKEGLFGW